MAAIRNSRQRQAIRSYLLSTKSHPTAEIVYENIQKTFPNISLGTIYRNLNFLVEHGYALQIDCGDGTLHFDGTTDPHNHFYCRICHRLIDLDMDSIEHINKTAASNFDGIIEGHSVLFHGVCGQCRQHTSKDNPRLSFKV